MPEHIEWGPSEWGMVEDLVREKGLEGVLMVLSEICDNHADHFAGDGKDAELANRWAEASGAIADAIRKATGLFGS